LVKRTNQYLEQSEPWKLAHDVAHGERLNTVLSTSAEALRLLAIYLAPFLPTASAKILNQLGLAALGYGVWESEGVWGAVPLGLLGTSEVLFPRFEEKQEIEVVALISPQEV
jgi:methionyl-tRNA synthetase